MNARLATSVVFLLGLVSCSSTSENEVSEARVREALARTQRSGLEGYRALLDLAELDHPAAHAALASAIRGPDPLRRNAAARALVEMGETRASEAWIANLDPLVPPHVAADAAHHLHAVYRQNLGYEPWLGVAHRSEVQSQWWSWWAREEGGRIHASPLASPEEANLSVDRRRSMQGFIGALTANSEPFTADDPGVLKMRRLASELGKSSHLEDLRLACEASAALAQSFPDEATFWLELGRAAKDAGLFEDSETAFRASLELTPDQLGVHLELAYLLGSLGRLDLAIEHCRAELAGDPSNMQAWCALGALQARRTEKSEAEASYERARELDASAWPLHELWLARLRGNLR